MRPTRALRLAAVLLAALSSWAAGAQAAAPRFILVTGPPHPRPVLVAGQRENLDLLTDLAASPFAPARVVRTLATRPRLDLALFWTWRHREAPAHPGDASQHGWLYPRWRSAPAVVALKLDDSARPRLVSPAALAMLAHHGVAVDGPERRCPVSLPDREVPKPGYAPPGGNFGNRRLRVALHWQGGILVAGELHDGGMAANVLPGGAISAKLGWYRESGSDRLRITGQRLDRQAPPLRSRVPAGYGGSLQVSGLVFPTTGCWRVEGRAGRGHLAFVVWVARTR